MILASLAIFGVLASFPEGKIYGATVTWDGGGADGTCGGGVGDGNKWSCGLNWSTDTVPTSADAVVFSGTSTKDATLDSGFAGVITSISINAGYTGTITLASSLQTTSTFSQAAGTFTAAAQSLDIDSTFTLSAGTFTASSGTTTVAGALTFSGSPTFNHNSGTITFDGGAATLTCNSVTFNLITINNTGTKTVGSTCSLPLGASPTLSGSSSVTLNGTLSGTGTLTKGSATLTLNAGASLSGFSGLSVLTFTVAGATADFSAYNSFVATGTVSLTSGSLSLPSGADLDTALTISSGTFTAPSGSMTVAGTLTISGSPTFNANAGTMIFDGGTATLTCNNVTFNAVILSNTSRKTIASSCTLPLGANPTMTSNVTLNGTLTGSGTLTETAGTLILNTGATLTGFTALAPNAMTVAGATLDLTSFTSYISNALAISSGSLTLPSVGATITNLTVSGGTFTSSSGTLAMTGTMSISGTPTFNNNGGTIQITGGNGSYTCNSVTFNLVTIPSNTGLKTINSDCSFPLGTNPTIAGEIVLNGTLSGSGTLSSNNTLTLNTGATLTGFNGLTTSVLRVAGASLDLSGYSTFIAAGDLTFASGSLSLPNGADLNSSLIMNSGGTFTAPSGTMTLAGNLTITGTPTINANGGTIVLDGTNQTISGGLTFYNLRDITPGTLSFTAGSTIIIAGSLDLQGSVSQQLILNSSTAGSQFSINPQGSRMIKYVSVQDSNNINSTRITANSGGIDLGNNTGWNFGTPGVSSFGPSTVIGGGFVSSTTPTLTFTTSDPDTSDTVKYRIQIDDSSDFLSPAVDYTSALAAQGSVSFTVGQAVGTGTYTVGSSGQTLSDGSYYWRVKATDVYDQSSSYTSASSGSIDFKVDTTAPTIPGTPSTSTSTNDSTPSWSWTASTDTSGVSLYIISWCQDSNFIGCDSYIDSTTTNSYTITSALADGTWYFRAKARDPVSFQSNYSTVGSTTINTSTSTTPSQSSVSSQPAAQAKTRPRSSAGAGGQSESTPSLTTIDEQHGGKTVTPAEVIEEGYTVSFTLLDDSGLPLKNIKVILRSVERIAYTDNQGVVTFTAVEKGEHTLVASIGGQDYSQKLTVDGDKKVIDFTIQTKAEEPFQSQPVRIVISGLVGGIAILIIGILIFMLRRRRQSSLVREQVYG